MLQFLILKCMLLSMMLFRGHLLLFLRLHVTFSLSCLGGDAGLCLVFT